MKKKMLFFSLILCFASLATANEDQTRWERKTPSKPNLELFHSMHVISLPTSETMQKHDFEFEISHRFIPPVTEGGEALYGIDGPVNMRLALAYAPTNDMVITLGRSNVNDNLDLQLRYKALKLRSESFPVLVTLLGGAAHNSQTYIPITDKIREYQFYGQLIVNTLIHKKLGIGIAPVFLNNSYIYGVETENSFVLGNYLQYYVSPAWSVMAEWAPTINGWIRTYNSFSFGFELETGGHFFKIFFSNNDLINMSQFLTGADIKPDNGDWRLGFMITRLLKFSK